MSHAEPSASAAPTRAPSAPARKGKPIERASRLGEAAGGSTAAGSSLAACTCAGSSTAASAAGGSGDGVHETAPPEPPAAEAAVDEPAHVQAANEEPAAVEPPAASPSREARSIGFPFLAGALGALVGAALALGSAWLIDPRAAVLDAATSRLTTLERGDQAQLQTNADFDKRLGALEGSRRAGQGRCRGARAAHRGAQERGGQRRGRSNGVGGSARGARRRGQGAGARDPSRPVGAAPTQSGAPVPFDASALQARLGAVESDLAALKSREADLGALDQRVAKIESALAAPKSEARVAAAEVAVSRGGAAEAILAISLNERLNAGAPFEQEWAALTRLGADGAKLAALKPFADAGARRLPRSPHPSPRSSPASSRRPPRRAAAA